MNRDNTLCIQPYPANRFYWQYKGQPLGGQRGGQSLPVHLRAGHGAALQPQP